MGVIEDRVRQRTITHVTLPHGTSRPSPQSEVAAVFLARLRDHVLPALAASVAVSVPGHPRYRLYPVAKWEGALCVRLESVAGIELQTIGIGWSEPGANKVWQSLASAVEEPRRPWVADVLALEGLMVLGSEGVSVAMWSAELARCLAWAVIPEA